MPELDRIAEQVDRIAERLAAIEAGLSRIEATLGAAGEVLPFDELRGPFRKFYTSPLWDK